MSRKKETIVSGTITSSPKRVGTSRNGNPTYEVVIGADSRLTVTDGSVGYAVNNFKTGDEVSALVVVGNRIADIWPSGLWKVGVTVGTLRVASMVPREGELGNWTLTLEDGTIARVEGRITKA